MTVYRRQPSNLAAPSLHAHNFDDVDVPGDWVEQALCATVGSDLFYRTEDSRFHAPYVTQAKQVCAACPVTAPCLAYALAHETIGRGSAGYGYGVAGGLTATERRRILVARDQED